MALSRVVSEIFNVEKCHDLEIRVKGHSWSLNMVPFDLLTIFEIFDFKNAVTLVMYSYS